MKKVFLFFALLISACGFRPMFSDGDTDIYVKPIAGINGIDLRNSLSAEFGGMRDESAKYTLVVNMGEPTTKYKGLEVTGDASWQEIRIRANYELFCGGKRIAKGTESAAESYTFVRYLVASNASYNNAVQNIIQVLADKISTRAITETVRHSCDNK